MHTIRRISFALFATVALTGISYAVGVIGISPASHSLASARNTQITITFDAAMDPATINASNISIFGHWSGVALGTFQLEAGNTRVRFTPTTLFNAGEWVLVSISKNVRTQAGQTLPQGYAWTFWIKPSVGTIVLAEIQRIPVRRSGEGHIQTYGAHGGDLNKDGFSDFFVPNEISNDCRVFLNDRSGNYSSFTVHPIPNGSRPSTNESADFNSDGNLDIAVGNSAGDSITVFLGNGTGGFLSIRNYQAAQQVRGLAVADFDGDGDADIVTANRNGNNIALLLNNGNGTFAPRTTIDANGVGETACATADANGDGILDLFVGCYSSSEMSLLLGNGTGGFTFSSKVAVGGSSPWMIAVGDVNGDGRVDVVSANAGSANASVIFGNGTGGLSAATTYAAASFPIAIDLGDIDGDGDLDLMTSNYTGRNWTYWENNGAGVFGNRRTLAAAQAGSCATFHDRDNDGDLDMTGIDEEADLIFLFRNGGATSVHFDAQPSEFSLRQNYPNPFNPTTRIPFTLRSAGFVSLKVYDQLGREVATLVNNVIPAGEHESEFDASNVPSGIYSYRLVAGERRETKRMVVIK
jgi:hypothetical protein